MQGLGPKTGEKSPEDNRTGKREGMAPMQWRDATVSETGATGLAPPGSVAARQEPDVRQVFDQIGIVAVTGSATALPVGLDLPCTEDPELCFAESPADVETAKAMC